MLKTADALSSAGYHVRVVSTSAVKWARDADWRTAAARNWQWQVVDHTRASAPGLYAMSGVRRHAARWLAKTAGPTAASWWACTRALSRVHDELVTQALSGPFDFVCGGSTGGLAVVEEVARRRGVPFGVDLEDLHTAESVAPDAALHHGLAKRVLDRVLSRAAFVTTSSECMAECYREQFGIRPAVVHNVFSLPSRAPSLNRQPGPLRLYWFSQTIGPGRGIEHAIAAVRHAGIPAEIVLRGLAAPGFLADVRRDAESVPNLLVRVEPPGDPDAMVDLCAGHDLGFSGETEPVMNRQVCLTNKIFTYLLAGMPVALSDTPAQRRLAGALGDAAFLYPPDDPAPLAGWLRDLAVSEERLRHHRQAAWTAAVERWHWEHPSEAGALLTLVRGVTG